MNPKKINFAPIPPEITYHNISGSLENKESKLFFFNRISVTKENNIILYDLPIYERRSIVKFTITSHTIETIFDVEKYTEICVVGDAGEQLTFVSQERCDEFLSQLFQIDPTS